MTRTLYVINTVTGKNISQYSTNHFDDTLDDIAANGFKTIDIKFDMDGDLVIFVNPVI